MKFEIHCQSSNNEREDPSCFVLWIYLLIQAYQGKMIVLPVIGPIVLGPPGH